MVRARTHVDIKETTIWVRRGPEIEIPRRFIEVNLPSKLFVVRSLRTEVLYNRQ